MKFIAQWLSIAWLMLLAIAAPAHAETLRLNSGVRAPYFQPDKQGFLDLLIPEIFHRIGVKAEAVQYEASERAMLNANNGIDDGTALRIKGLEKTYPNLVRIEEKILDNDFVAYATRVDFATTGYETLKPYQVGHIIGWKIFEANLVPGTAITKVNDAEQLFTLLEMNRADVVLFERWQGNNIIRQRALKARRLSPPLATTEMFMYLHKKHAHLAEPAARALRAMKADGSYQRIVDKTLPRSEAK